MYVYINLATATAFAYNLRTGVQVWSTTIPNANPYAVAVDTKQYLQMEFSIPGALEEMY